MSLCYMTWLFIIMKTLIGQIGLLRAIVRIFRSFAIAKLHQLSRQSYVYTTLVTIKNTIKIRVEYYGLFFNLFSMLYVFFEVRSLFLQLIDLGTSRS